MKIAAGMIVFEGDYVLQQCLEQIYPHVEQILIAEGPVLYWQQRGLLTSRDRTNEIIENFPDPHKKIIVTHGQYKEKDEQCRAYMKYVRDDIDYIWNVDSDEVYSHDACDAIKEVLEEQKPTSVGVRSISFFGGMNHYLTGFEMKTDNFLRIFKYEPGSTWETHRPPTIQYKTPVERYHIDSDKAWHLGIHMHHYSYVFPSQVKKKVGYYKECVSKDNCIDNYFNNVYIPWVTGDDYQKKQIERVYRGVHEFKPQIRGDCYTKPYIGEHPEAIQRDLFSLGVRFGKELAQWI